MTNEQELKIEILKLLLELELTRGKKVDEKEIVYDFLKEVKMKDLI